MSEFLCIHNMYVHITFSASTCVHVLALNVMVDTDVYVYLHHMS